MWGLGEQDCNTRLESTEVSSSGEAITGEEKNELDLNDWILIWLSRQVLFPSMAVLTDTVLHIYWSNLCLFEVYSYGWDVSNEYFLLLF